jgi:hypothetical protein
MARLVASSAGPAAFEADYGTGRDIVTGNGAFSQKVDRERRIEFKLPALQKRNAISFRCFLSKIALERATM